ncbi:MAG: hypothetical protein ABJC66_11865 [Gammaproteobacteria bacterium]
MVVDVNHGGVSLSPQLKEFANTRLRLRVIASAPSRVIEPDLHVNDDERCGRIECRQFLPPSGEYVSEFAERRMALQNADTGIASADG